MGVMAWRAAGEETLTVDPMFLRQCDVRCQVQRDWKTEVDLIVEGLEQQCDYGRAFQHPSNKATMAAMAAMAASRLGMADSTSHVELFK